MGFFNATNPLTGEIISHQIEGDTPTEEEALEIEQYMALFNKKAIPDNVPDDEGNLFTKGVARGVDTLQMMYGSAIQGLGETFDSDLLKDYGAEVVEKNKEEIQSNIEYAKRLDDIKGAGSFFDWTASTLGEQVPQLGSTLAGAGTGAAIGSVIPVIGTFAGSIIGGITANLPFFYGGNREAQKEEIAAGNRIEISEGAAALTAIPQSALDFIADRFLIGGFTGKALAGGGIFTRGVKGISIGAVTEVPTEIGQQVLERFQAGKDLLSEEAMNEYYEVAAAAALVGGTVRGTGTIIGGDKAKAEDKAKSTEQDEDLRTEIQSAKVMADNATNFINQEKNLEDLKNPNGTNLTLSQLPEHIKQEVMDNRPDVVVTDETLTQDDLDVVLNRINDNDADTKDTKYNKVKDAVKNKGQYTHAIAKEALKTKKTQTIKQSTLNRIRDKLLTNNVIKKEGAKLVPATTSEQDLKLKAEQIKAKAKEIVKNLEILNKQKEQRTTLEDPSLEDVKAIDDIDNTIGQLQEDYSKVEKIANNVVTESERKLGKDAVRLAQILPPIDAKQAFDNANALKKEYIASKNKIIKNLRKKLNNIGLKDVKLEGQDIISLGKLSPEETIERGAIPEGSYGNRVIALAMKIYDPSLSDADIEKKLASVMNHEIIHALKDLNLFTQKEYETLVNAANKRKYVVMHDGNPVERKYTYMERAARLYGNLDSEAQAEEAVAELYRDWADGKLKLGGKPKTVFQKIVAFVKSIFQSHSEAGFKDADSIFQNLKTIGRRERDVNSNIKSEKKGSIAGIVAGYIEPEKGNVDRIAKDFKQVTKRVPELQKAAQELQDGKIDYKEYDKRVNKFKPILPYTTVPLPATTSEMRGALTKNKQDKLNKINEVPDGTTVRLRLDIPAYTGSGVWIPTIHDSSNKVLSHESVVIVNNAALEPTVGAQRIGLRIATGAQKGPFATIEGSLEKTTPEAALAEAQAAINDPSFVQVGFDPERHSYFYDRTTTQSVIGADRVIQVGPLVMAKNPVFGRKQDYKYSVIGQQNLKYFMELVEDKKANLLVLKVSDSGSKGFVEIRGKLGYSKNRLQQDNETFQQQGRIDEVTELPLNADGTVTVYHHTNRRAAKLIKATGQLRSAGEPDVYVTTRAITDTGYGDTAVAIRVEPSRLSLDDEFPNGRRDFRLSVGKPRGSIRVDVIEDGYDPNDNLHQVLDKLDQSTRIKLFKKTGKVTLNPDDAKTDFYSLDQAKDILSEEYYRAGLGFYGTGVGFDQPEALDNRLLGIIRDNPDGFTVDPDSLESASSGIAVAPVKAAEIRVKPENLNEELLYQYAEYLYIMSQLSKTKMFAGGWFNKKTKENPKGDNLFYLDATMVVDDFADALYIGEAAEQKAIFNLSTFEETVTTDGIKRLQETGAYDSKRRAERQRDIQKLTQEFKKTRYQRQAEQKSRVSSPTRIEAGQERDIKEQVGYYPTVDDNGFTTLTHYSPIPNIAVISPDMQGTNFNIRGQETLRRRIFSDRYVPRNYYGLNVKENGGYRKETGLGDNTYEGIIEVNRLYPLDADPNGYLVEAAEQAQEEERGGPDTGKLTATLLEKRIRDEGFVGYWTGQQLGMVAAVFDPVPVLPEGETKFSVRGVNPEQLSIVDMMNPDGTFEQLEPPNTVKITEAVKKEMTRRGNVTLDIKNPEEKELAIQTMLLELKANINADDSAIGWYKETLQNAKKLYANVYPEIFTDKNAESAFDFILAISSNGTSVINQNIDLAKQFENWQKTGLLLEEKGMGEQGAAQVRAYQVYNLLKTELGKTDLQIKEFFNKTLLVRDINNIPFLKEANVNIATETVNAELPVSYILGSKIGAFYQNIIGDYSHLTMDRWYMRFYNRVTGDPFVRVQEKTLVKNRRKVQEETSIALAQGTDDEKSRITAAMNEAGIDNLTDATVTDFATAITIKYQRDFVYTRSKDLPRPPKTTFIKEAENLFRNTSVLLQEVPRTKQAREDIRDIFKEVVTRYNRDTDRPITIADAQAVQWYAEKRFFHAMGVRKGVGNDNDYIDAAISFLRKRGINEETIGQTLPESIRIRLNDKRNTGEQSVTITGEARQNVGYEKRRLTKDELDGYDALEGVSEQDINNANELVDNARYALIGVPKPITDTYFKAESPLARVAYGAIQAEDRGPRNVIFYTTGEHAEKAVGTNDFDQPILEYRGFGKSHIDAPRDKLNRFDKAIGKQSHAEELMEIFDYNSVEDLLFQSFVLLQNQQLKGINNGIKIISDVGQGDIRLEFNKAPLKNKDAKQVKLVIPLKFVKRGNRIDPEVEFRAKSDTFVVRTAYAAEKKYSVVGATMDNMQSTPTSDAIVQGAQDTKDYMIYDNLSKVLAKAGKFLTVGQVEEQALRKKAQDFLIKFQDRMLPIGELVDNLRAMGLKITEAMDTYMQEEVFHGRAGAKIDEAQKKLFTPMVNIINSLNIDATKLNELKQSTKSKQGNGFFEQASDNYENEKLALADTVLYAFHAKERNNRLNNPKGAGMGNAEAQAVIDWIGSLDQTNQDKIFQIRQSARDVVANTNKERRDGGLIPRLFTDPVTGKEYDKIYDDYVPLRGDMDAIQEDEADFSGNPVRQIKNLFGAIGRQDKKAKGRTKKDIDNFYARDITANLFYQNQKSINTGERNKVGLSFLRLVRGQEEGATEVNVNLQKAMQEHANVYFNLKDAKADGYTTRDEIGKEVVDRSRVLTVRENGQDVYIAMKDQRIARAMKGFMSPDSVGGFTRALGKLNRYLSNINTSYNPEFMITNFTRDLGTAGVNLQQFGGEKGFTREVLKGAFSAVNGIRKVLRNDDTSSYWAKKYEEFVNAGGRNATNQMSDLQDQMNNLQSVIGDIGSDSKKGLFGKAKNGVKKVGQFLDDYNTAVENGVRVATYDALIKRGFSPTRAAQAARNVTVNFAKGGEQKQFLNSWYLFYNASLQGSMAIINAAIRSPRVRKVWGGLIVFGVLSDYFAEAMSGDEDEDGVKDYDELPRYILEHNLIFPTFGLSEDKFIKIPLPYGLNIATNFGRSLARASRGEYTVGQASRSIFGTAFESLSPFGGFDNFYNFASPTFADPFVSVAINEDYKGDPIFKETPQFSSRPTPESYLHWSSTSTVAKTIAESVNDLTGGDNFKSGLLDFSPDVLEFWFDYITGGAGRFVQRSLEAPFDIVDVMNEDFRGDITQKLPFIRRVLQSPSEREDTATYLENRKEVFTLFARLDLARRSGDSEAINELLRNNREQIAIIPRLKAVDNARNRLQRQIREIERNPRLNEELKKRLIKLRRDRINDLMRRGLILMRSVGYKETG